MCIPNNSLVYSLLYVVLKELMDDLKGKGNKENGMVKMIDIPRVESIKSECRMDG